MVCRDTGRLFRVSVIAALVALGLALPAAAQTLVVGTVKDVTGKPLEGAVVIFEPAAGGRKTEKKTNKNGEFTQAGLISGAYLVTVSKEGFDSANGELMVKGTRTPVAFVLGVSATAPRRRCEVDGQRRF